MSENLWRWVMAILPTGGEMTCQVDVGDLDAFRKGELSTVRFRRITQIAINPGGIQAKKWPIQAMGAVAKTGELNLSQMIAVLDVGDDLAGKLDELYSEIARATPSALSKAVAAAKNGPLKLISK